MCTHERIYVTGERVRCADCPGELTIETKEKNEDRIFERTVESVQKNFRRKFPQRLAA